MLENSKESLMVRLGKRTTEGDVTVGKGTVKFVSNGWFGADTLQNKKTNLQICSYAVLQNRRLSEARIYCLPKFAVLFNSIRFF